MMLNGVSNTQKISSKLKINLKHKYHLIYYPNTILTSGFYVILAIMNNCEIEHSNFAR